MTANGIDRKHVSEKAKPESKKTFTNFGDILYFLRASKQDEKPARLQADTHKS
jgi:hypothetical protein